MVRPTANTTDEAIRLTCTDLFVSAGSHRVVTANVLYVAHSSVREEIPQSWSSCSRSSSWLHEPHSRDSSAIDRATVAFGCTRLSSRLVSAASPRLVCMIERMLICPDTLIHTHTASTHHREQNPAGALRVDDRCRPHAGRACVFASFFACSLSSTSSLSGCALDDGCCCCCCCSRLSRAVRLQRS
jgi:hypothetical protein